MLLYAPILLFGGFVGGITAIGSSEFLRACKIPKGKGFYVVTILHAFLFPLGFAMGQRDLTVLALSLLLLSSLFVIIILNYSDKGSVPFETLMLCFFAGIVFPLFYSSLLLLRDRPNGQYMVLLPLVAAFATDTGAYFVGITMGKHRNILKVSPNKSLEGFLGGIFFGMIGFLLYGWYLQGLMPVSVGMMGLYGLVSSVMTELGDLSFSLVKRQKGIKDYGNFIPGHGGILDRFDSMTFAAPTLLLLVELFPAF